MEQLCAVWYAKHDLRVERRTVELLAHLELQSLITDRFPRSSAPAAVENVKAGRGIKTVVEPR